MAGRPCHWERMGTRSGVGRTWLRPDLPDLIFQSRIFGIDASIIKVGSLRINMDMIRSGISRRRALAELRPGLPDCIIHCIRAGVGGIKKIGRMTIGKTGIRSTAIIRHPRDNTSNSNYHRRPLNSTSIFPYRIGADRPEETAYAERERIMRFMQERMFEKFV